MPLRCCAMGRVRGEEEEQQQQQQRAAVVAAPRRGRWIDAQQQPPAAGAGQAASGRAGWRCRSCAAAAIADCVALGCCPCAVVALLGLALVRAPLAVGRRLRGRRRSPLRRKRVRDDKGAKAAGAGPGSGSGTLLDPGDHAAAVPAAAAPVQQAEAEELAAWLDEMYRVGHWGFGRVSSSGSAGKTP